ncbi:hypothetical protein D3C80_1812240 [compost metagenome]
MLISCLVDLPEMDGGRQFFIIRRDRHIDLLAEPGKIGLNALRGIRAKQLDAIGRYSF